MSAIINVNFPFVYVQSNKKGANVRENFEKKGLSKKSLCLIHKYVNIYGIEVESKFYYNSKKQYLFIKEMFREYKNVAWFYFKRLNKTSPNFFDKGGGTEFPINPYISL